MRLTPYSYNGFLFNRKGKVESDFQDPYDWSIGGIATDQIPRSQNFPLRTGKNYSGDTKVVNVNLLDVDATRDDLVIAMDVLGEDQGQLISVDEHGNQWYVLADFIGLNEDGVDSKNPTAAFGAIFAVDDPIWRKLRPSSLEIEVDGTGSGTITPIGNEPALPTITITADDSGGFGFAHKRFISVINNSPNAFVNYELDINEGGDILDTAQLIIDNELESDGKDLRVYLGATELRHWFGGGGVNSSTLKLWINHTQPAKNTLTLGVAIDNSTLITEIWLENTANNVAGLQLLDPFGIVQINGERFVYTAKDLINLKLIGVTRAERQTSMEAHSLGDSIDYVPDLWIYYGYPTIAAYVEDTTYKPVIDLVNSTNELHIWEDLFRDAAGNRSGSWSEFVVLLTSNFPDSHNYTGPQNTFADPATVIGTYIKGKSIMGWKLYEPCGITDIEVAGQGYATLSRWRVVLESSFNGIDYINNIEIFDPLTPGAWTPISFGPASLGATYFYVRNRAFGDVIDEQYNELSDVTVELDTTLTPTITVGDEGAGLVNLHSVISNDITDESLEIDIALVIGASIVINTRERTITLSDGTNVIDALINMPIRAEWFRLLPRQENNISIVEAAQALFRFDYEDRSL